METKLEQLYTQLGIAQSTLIQILDLEQNEEKHNKLVKLSTKLFETQSQCGEIHTDYYKGKLGL